MGEQLIYTGVGSRQTPSPMLVLMEGLARDLRELGYTCRSGHAEGADSAFESGASGRIELYLPWKTFNGPPLHKPDLLMECPTVTARDIAMLVHPMWDRVSRGGRLLHARNVHQVLGKDLLDVKGKVQTLGSNAPASSSKFLLCWTTGGRVTGGTATAIRLATIFGIPVYNLWRAEDRKRFGAEFNLPVVA